MTPCLLCKPLALLGCHVSRRRMRLLDELDDNPVRHDGPQGDHAMKYTSPFKRRRYHGRRPGRIQDESLSSLARFLFGRNEIPLPDTAQGSESDGQGAGKEEDHVRGHPQPLKLVIEAAHQERDSPRMPVPVRKKARANRRREWPQPHRGKARTALPCPDP